MQPIKVLFSSVCYFACVCSDVLIILYFFLLKDLYLLQNARSPHLELTLHSELSLCTEVTQQGPLTTVSALATPRRFTQVKSDILYGQSKINTRNDKQHYWLIKPNIFPLLLPI